MALAGGGCGGGYGAYPGGGYDYGGGYDEGWGAGAATDEWAREDRHLDKAYADTYEQRRLEGRPVHAQTSYVIIGLGVAAFIIQSIALILPSWRGNWIGVFGYPHMRTWGLIGVRGHRFTNYVDQSNVACQIYGQMHVGGFCVSPLCVWYKAKCMTYLEMLCVNFGILFVFSVTLIAHATCLYWTCTLTPQSISKACIWWFVVALLHLGALIGYVFFTGDIFSSLMTHSYYPEPDFHPAFFLSCFSCLCLCIIGGLGWQLAELWPVPKTDEEDGEVDDESADEDYD